jgi:SAM-dependent methyltransferase
MRNAAKRLEALGGCLRPGARILDVGAGGGEFVALAQSQGYVAEGVEPGAAYAAYARKRYGVKIDSAPFLQIDFGDRVFDMITCSHALEHMRDPLSALKKKHSLLAPGGYVHIWVPDLAKAGEWPYRCFHPGHLHGVTGETLLMMMAKAGFELPAKPWLGTFQVLKRGSQSDPDWFRFPEHAESFKSSFAERTVWRYLISRRTWGRIPARIAYSVADRVFPLRKTPMDQGQDKPMARTPS